MIHARALFNDGRTAVNHAATVSPQGEMLRIFSQDGHVLADWHQDDIVADNPKATPLRLRCRKADGERLTIVDETVAEAVLEWLAPVIKAGRASWRRKWVAGFAAVWLLLAGAWLSAPLVVKGVVSYIPISWEYATGKEARDYLGRVLGTGPEDRRWLEDNPGASGLLALANRLTEAQEGQLFVVSLLNADMVNAFALPGGQIVITTGLVRQCRDADELAGVLAHEMAHVTERHNTRRLVRDQLFTFLLRVTTSGSDALSALGKGTSALFSGKLSREDESEADLLGVERLASAGINPLAGSLFFEGLSQEQKEANEDASILSYLASHPALTERQEAIRREAARFSGPFTPALTMRDWLTLRTLCRKRVPGDEI